MLKSARASNIMKVGKSVRNVSCCSSPTEICVKCSLQENDADIRSSVNSNVY